MTEYLIVQARPVNAWSGLPRQGPQAPHNPLPGGHRSADDENRVVTANGAEDIRPSLAIQRGSDGLSTARNGAQNEHLADALDSQEKLRQQRVEGGSALLYSTVGDRIPGAFRRRHPGEAQLPEISGQGRLGDVPAPLEEQLAQILLAAHHPGVDDL